MKKLIAFLCSIVVCIILIVGVHIYYDKKVSDEYFDKAAEILRVDKFESIKLQTEGIKQRDNLFIFGSSELEVGKELPTHPINFFEDKKDGFQVNLIGRAGSQSLVHAIDFGTIGSNLKNKKVVFIVSPQWFNKDGISESYLEANSSELQMYSFFFDKKIDRNLKETLANRILEISKKNPNEKFEILRDYCSLYSKEDFVHKALLYSMTPYYWMRYELLSIKDDVNSNRLLKSNNKTSTNDTNLNNKINWNMQFKNALQNAKKGSHNKFDMDDKSYNNLIKSGKKLKGSMSKISYKVSPEYDDFRFLLDICKEKGIEPLIVSIPVGGKFYDYCGHNILDRKSYYNEINKIVKSYGFEEADFSGHEYDKDFLMDGAHLGLKGWIYVNQAIDKYYHEN